MASLITLLKQKNYVVYSKPFELNIIGIRHTSTTPNQFDDSLIVLFKNGQNKWEQYKYTITTDPSTYWLANPMQVEGTAILKQGQYINTYQIGLHRGQYTALVQRKPVTVIRDYDRNAILDFNNGTESTGLYGINIHRASIHGITKTVGKWSAGCQVFAANAEFIQFMDLCNRHRSLYGNSFTYTLLDERMLSRQTKRYLLYGTLAVGLAAFTTYKVIT